jgi:hypothetical protein
MFALTAILNPIAATKPHFGMIFPKSILAFDREGGLLQKRLEM